MICLDSLATAMSNASVTVFATKLVDTRLVEKACDKVENGDKLPTDVISKITSGMTSAERDKLSKALVNIVDPDLDALIEKIFSQIDTVEKIEKLIAD